MSACVCLCACVCLQGGGQLYFRGQINRDETIRSLLSLGMRHAKEVVLMGCSAGALGVYLGIDQMTSIIHQEGHPGILVRGLAVSGFFLNYSSPILVNEKNHHLFDMTKDDGIVNGRLDYPLAMEKIYDMMNLSAGINQNCLHSNPHHPSRCLLAENILPFLTTPLFSVQVRHHLLISSHSSRVSSSSSCSSSSLVSI